MLAVANRRGTRVGDADPGPIGARVPRTVFRAAYKQLCTRIWIELEFLAQAMGQAGESPSQDLVMSAAILRLEFIVLADSCRSAHWRRMLSAEQCDTMCSMLTDVLAALYVDSECLPAGIAEAQNRVLAELSPDPEAAASSGELAPEGELVARSDRAVQELISLLEARAAVHVS